MGISNSLPIRIFDPLLVPSPVESTVAQSSDHEAEILSSQIRLQLVSQTTQAIQVNLAVLGLGVGFSLHPDESHRLDLAALNLIPGLLHHGIVENARLGVGRTV